MKINERVQQLRGKRRQNEISARTGIPQEVLSRIENGHKEPSLRQLVALANVHNMSVIMLLNGVDLDGELYSAPMQAEALEPLPFD